MTSGDLDLWDMVTKKNLYNPGRVLDICAKNEVDPTIGLGGVRPQTDRHTHKQRTYGYYSIDCTLVISVLHPRLFRVVPSSLRVVPSSKCVLYPRPSSKQIV